MPEKLRKAMPTNFLLAFLLLPLSALAQSDRLYRIELVVFSHSGGGGAEQWEATPELEYPTRSRFLIYPGEQQPTAQAASPGAAVPGDIGGAPAVPPTSAPATSEPGSYTTLPAAQRELAASAANMQRSGRYRILFHEAWTQPLADRAGALSVVLDRSGDGGPWPELQGSVRFYLAGFFHIETNLWLNTQGEYLNSDWRMPPPPRGPASRPAPESFQAPPPSVSPDLVAGAVEGTGSAIASPLEYPFRHAVLLQETRRVRSSEVTYIDHPLLALLVKITPVGTTATEAAQRIEAGTGVSDSD